MGPSIGFIVYLVIIVALGLPAILSCFTSILSTPSENASLGKYDHYYYVDGVIESVTAGTSSNSRVIICFADGRIIPFGLDTRDGIIIFFSGKQCRIYYDHYQDIRAVEKIEPVSPTHTTENVL